jgi:hypothetical protein
MEITKIDENLTVIARKAPEIRGGKTVISAGTFATILFFTSRMSQLQFIKQ